VGHRGQERRPGKLSGLEAFKQRYPKARVWLVGGGGVDLEEFFLRPATDWLRDFPTFQTCAAAWPRSGGV